MCLSRSVRLPGSVCLPKPRDSGSPQAKGSARFLPALGAWLARHGLRAGPRPWAGTCRQRWRPRGRRVTAAGSSGGRGGTAAGVAGRAVRSGGRALPSDSLVVPAALCRRGHHSRTACNFLAEAAYGVSRASERVSE